MALALVFALLFYEEDRLKELFQIAKPDHLSVLYLKLLLNIKPDDTDLRAELVRHYINLGELDEARAALEPLLPKNGMAELSVRLLALEIEFRDFLSISHEHPSRKMKLTHLQNSIVEVSRAKLPVSSLPDIIKLGLELEQPAVGLAGSVLPMVRGCSPTISACGKIEGIRTMVYGVGDAASSCGNI